MLDAQTKNEKHKRWPQGFPTVTVVFGAFEVYFYRNTEGVFRNLLYIENSAYIEVYF